ncbi:PTS system mannose/fructose/N-acetylgalactosamine-transporter subunit IIB [Candidatus Enterococcus ferrettii]|uniref:PTS system, mannose-specific IIB component n=1 Tax=Candidatus Enterococcus ferrettii TaxID=2815324 RepID=A0ABV0EQ48_9ENTE|nr:PTS sugar transporter subunit IIB [Enterococcus sp. 665A]MBO1339298.1 PTS sugar transporter subunit IIB [Enterococcus sp. 665A]
MLFIRCDDRLVHGQVLFKWTNEKNIKKIVVVDTNTATDLIEKQMILMSKPKNCDIEILRSTEMDCINHDRQEAQMILFKDVQTACSFVANRKIDRMNIGRMASGIGKIKVFNNLFLTQNEISELHQLINEEVFVYYQMVPDENAIDLKKIIEELRS